MLMLGMPFILKGYMKEIIKIEEMKFGNNNINAIDAKELYEFLGVKERYDNWIKRYLLQFEKGNDFSILSEERHVGFGTRKIDIHYISIDMAKHMSMMSQCEKANKLVNIL